MHYFLYICINIKSGDMIEMLIELFSGISMDGIKKFGTHLNKKFFTKKENLLDATIHDKKITVTNNSADDMNDVHVSSDDFWSLTPKKINTINVGNSVIINVDNVIGTSTTPSIFIEWLDKHKRAYKVKINVHPKIL